MTRARFLVLAGVLAAAAAGSFALGGNPLAGPGYREPAVPFGRFPLRISGWEGRDLPLPATVRDLVGMDRYLRREYRAPDGGTVLFYVSYHGNKERGFAAIYHNPTVCLPSAGWAWADSRRREVTLADLAMEFEVSLDLFRHERTGAEKLVLNFFVVEERRVLSEAPRNAPFWLGLEKLRPGDGPGYLVQAQIVADVRDGREEAEERVVEFLESAGGRIFLHF